MPLPPPPTDEELAELEALIEPLEATDQALSLCW